MPNLQPPDLQQRTHKWVRQPALHRIQQHKLHAGGDASMFDNELTNMSQNFEQTGSRPASGEGHRYVANHGLWLVVMASGVQAAVLCRMNNVNGDPSQAGIVSFGTKAIAYIDNALLSLQSFCVKIVERLEVKDNYKRMKDGIESLKDESPTKADVFQFMQEGVSVLKDLTYPSPKEIAWKAAVVFLGIILLMILVRTFDSGCAASLARIPKNTV